VRRIPCLSFATAMLAIVPLCAAQQPQPPADGQPPATNAWGLNSAAPSAEFGTPQPPGPIVAPPPPGQFSPYALPPAPPVNSGAPGTFSSNPPSSTGLPSGLDDYQIGRPTAHESWNRSKSISSITPVDLNNGPQVFAAPYAQPANWVGGLSVYTLTPRWSSGNTALVVRTANSGNFFDRTTADFNYGYRVSPGFWLGYVGDSGVGVRTNFFQFNQSASNYAVSSSSVLFDPYRFGGTDAGIFTSVNGAALLAQSSLQLMTWDLEATKRVNYENWTLTAAAGLRYLHLNQTYSADISPPSAANGFFARTEANHSFNGLGPTFAVNGRHALGDTSLGVFGGGRGSLLFGSLSQSVASFYPGANASSTDNTGGKGLLPVAELEIGIDYRQPIGRVTLLIENSLIGQAWFNAGSASNTNGLDGSISSATLGLFGLRSSIGLTY
jgi:hypothetical protein